MHNFAVDLTMSPTTRRHMRRLLQRANANIVAAARDMRRCAPIVQKANADFVRSMRRASEAWLREQGLR